MPGSHLLPRRLLLDLMLGIGVTVLLFALAEGALVLTGAGGGELRPPRHLAAGFDPDARAFERDPETGGWRGRYSHKAVNELKIAPKGEALRVIMFGGSNTAGFSRATLARALEGHVGRKVEVLNLGRPGYGSTRVAILFREALQVLEPDAVILYSGHNEFVEKSFAMDIEAAWSNPVEAALASALERTVTGRVITDRIRAAGKPASKYSKLADWEAEYQKFKQIAWHETDAIWDAYEQNLGYMCALAQEQGVPLLLSTLVWNRLSAPRVSTPDPALPSADVEQSDRLRRRARGSYPPQLEVLLPRRDQERVHMFDWGLPGQTHPEGIVQEELPGLRPSLGFLAGRELQIPYARPWKAKIHDLYRAVAWLHAGANAEQRPGLEAANKLLRQARKLQPRDAHILYEGALVDYALGERGTELTRRFERAARFDRAPRKANPESNDRVRRLGAQQRYFLDADALFAAASADALVGWEWMCDHCHLTEAGGDALLEAWAEALAPAWKEQSR